MERVNCYVGNFRVYGTVTFSGLFGNWGRKMAGLFIFYCLTCVKCGLTGFGYQFRIKGCGLVGCWAYWVCGPDFI